MGWEGPRPSASIENLSEQLAYIVVAQQDSVSIHLQPHYNKGTGEWMLMLWCNEDALENTKEAVFLCDPRTWP